MKFLVMGAYGLLGSRLCPALEVAGHRVVKQSRWREAEFSVEPTDLASVEKLISTTAPDAVINLNALTDVDGCEDNPAEAYRANVRSAEVLATLLQGTSIYLIHLSTDQVYSGKGPHQEHQVLPCNVYGLSKYAGELACQAMRASVLRTNFVGHSIVAGRLGFTDWLYRAFSEDQKITLFEDVWFSPLHIDQLASALEWVGRKQPEGIFNLGAREGVSKAGFALKFAERLGLDTSSAELGKLAEKPLRAPRPLDMQLEVNEFERLRGTALPDIDLVINAAVADYS